MREELWQLGVHELLAGYRERRFSPTEVVDACLARLERVDQGVNAFVEVLADQARGEAERLTRDLARGRAAGALFGVPLAVKEIIGVAGAVTSAFTEVELPWGGRPAATDAAPVAAARAEGAIVLGRTCTHEFAWGITSRHARLGGVVNPWGRDRSAGGSSGGSAAAVATGMAPLALGTDTGGSIRIPAANCGVTGWKLNWRPELLTGVIPLAPSLDSIGVMARSLTDAVAALKAVTGAAVAALPPGPPAGLRVGVLRSAALPPLPDPVGRALGAAAEAVEAGGAVVEEARPDWIAEALEIYIPLQMFEARRVHAEELGTWPAQAGSYGPDVRQRLTAADGIPAGAYDRARERAGVFADRMARLLDRFACLLAPVAACGPPTIADPDTAPVGGDPVPYRDLVLPFTVPANVAGIHAVSVPAGFDGDAMPIAVQVLGADPGLVARVAAAVEAGLAVTPGWPPTAPAQAGSAGTTQAGSAGTT